MEPTNINSNTQETNSLNAPAKVDLQAIGVEQGTRQVNLADLDWSAAATVKAVGYRFLVPVPNLGSENEVITVKDWRGNEKSVTGFAFQNSTDAALQAVSGEGNGVLIFAVDAEKVDRVQFAQAMFAAIDTMGGVHALDKASLTRLIGMLPSLVAATAYSQDALPKADVYDSDDSITAGLAPQSGLQGDGSRPFGLFEKADKPGPVAVYVEGNCEVAGGPHASTAKYEHGFMAVKLPPKKEGQESTYRSIAPEAISYCYVLADGNAIKTADLPQV